MKNLILITLISTVTSLDAFAKCDKLVGTYRCECTSDQNGSFCNTELSVTQVDGELFLQGGPFRIEGGRPLPADNSSYTSVNPGSHFVGAADSMYAKCKADTIKFHRNRGGYVGHPVAGMRMDRELQDILISVSENGVSRAYDPHETYDESRGRGCQNCRS